MLLGCITANNYSEILEITGKVLTAVFFLKTCVMLAWFSKDGNLLLLTPKNVGILF